GQPTSCARQITTHSTTSTRMRNTLGLRADKGQAHTRVSFFRNQLASPFSARRPIQVQPDHPPARLCAATDCGHPTAIDQWHCGPSWRCLNGPIVECHQHLALLIRNGTVYGSVTEPRSAFIAVDSTNSADCGCAVCHLCAANPR